MNKRRFVIKIIKHPISLIKLIPKFFLFFRRNYKRDVKYIYSFLMLSGKDGYLKKRYIFKLAVRNVIKTRSRTSFTIGGIALGIATIVFLVSFAYGLQNIVEKRLVKPTSLRMIDVQTDSAKLVLNNAAIDDIKKIENVEDAVPSVSVAGSVTILGSKTDVVVLGAGNKFLDYSYLDVYKGDKFSDEAEAFYSDENKVQEEVEKVKQLIQGIESLGDVKGVSDEEVLPEIGKIISPNGLTEKFRVMDYAYIPVRQKPNNNSLIIGYMSGRVSETFEGTPVWGEMYRSINTSGKAYQLEDGSWLGKWMLVDKAPMYKKENDSYTQLFDDEEKQIPHTQKGYITFSDIYVLTLAELKEETELQNVLGLSDSNTEEEKTVEDDVYKVEFVDELTPESAPESKELEELVNQDVQNEALFDFAYINILKPNGKEVLLSSNLVTALKKSPDELIGKEIYIDLIINNGLIPSVNAKLISQANKYKVIGVFREDQKPIVIIPFTDFKSIGVDRYSVVKVLAKTTESLPNVRADIQVLGFNTQSVVDTLKQVNKLFNFIRIILGFMGVMALVVAVVGMVNTLTVSLLERTREVGVMKTLGTTNLDVTRLFLLEAVFISSVGGIAGVVLGILAGVVINIVIFLIKKGEYISLFMVPPIFVVIMVLIALVIGIITGIYPARRSGKISGLDAIKHE